MTHTEETYFETDFHYAIVAGWLIFPAIGTLFGFFDNIILLYRDLPFQGRTMSWDGFLVDFILALLYFYVIYSWVKRKQRLPALMIILYSLATIQYVIIWYLNGTVAGMIKFVILMNIIWIGYFIVSKRVKATFVR